MNNSGKTGWRSPSNIAVVKYWGKKGFQIPDNPSLSMTLTNCYTETEITYSRRENMESPGFIFTFENKRNIPFEEKVGKYIEQVRKEFSVLRNFEFNINSSNSFPHSAGIASSASAISAMALCFCQIIREVSGALPDDETFYKTASHLARIGSGSASRSVYGGWVLWGESRGIAGSSDLFAMPVNHQVHPVFSDYYDAILIVHSGVKPVSSREGHSLMETNPFQEVRAETGKENILKLLNAMHGGNKSQFGEIAEYEAANLHAMFLTSKPPFLLIQPATIQIINKLMQFRKETGVEFTFTLDAGPNIHLLYPQSSRDKLIAFIKSDLEPYCEDRKWIDDKIGQGPINLL